MNAAKRVRWTRVTTWAKLSAGALIVGTALGLAGAAQASTATINETTDYNTVYNWDTGRVNTYRYNAMSFALSYWEPGTGGYIIFGARNDAGVQFAATHEMTTNKSYPFYTNSGSLQIPSGTFYLNTHIVGGCGGSGCGLQTFKGTLTYNVNNP